MADMVRGELDILRSLKRKRRNKKIAGYRNVIKLYDVFEDHNYLYMVTNYCQGGTLEEFLSKKKTLHEAELAQMIKQILEGVHFLHVNCIAHLDLKPNNVMFASNKSKDAPIQLVDFGLSHVIPRLMKKKRFSWHLSFCSTRSHTRRI